MRASPWMMVFTLLGGCWPFLPRSALDSELEPVASDDTLDTDGVPVGPGVSTSDDEEVLLTQFGTCGWLTLYASNDDETVALMVSLSWGLADQAVWEWEGEPMPIQVELPADDGLWVELQQGTDLLECLGADAADGAIEHRWLATEGSAEGSITHLGDSIIEVTLGLSGLVLESEDSVVELEAIDFVGLTMTVPGA